MNIRIILLILVFVLTSVSTNPSPVLAKTENLSCEVVWKIELFLPENPQEDLREWYDSSRGVFLSFRTTQEKDVWYLEHRMGKKGVGSCY